MIKFILLLPFKIIGLLFIAIGAILERHEKNRIAAAREYEKRIATELKEKERRERAARIATEKANRTARIEKEKLEKEKKRRAAETFKKDQARIDLEHYLQQRRDLLKLYNELQKQYDATTTENRKETLYRKILAINNQVRAADRTIERLQYIIAGSG